MKILLDGRPLQGPTGRRGVGRYVADLVRGLAATGGGSDVTLLLDRRGGPVSGSGVDRSVNLAHVSSPPGPALFWGRVLGPRWIAAHHPDVFHATFLAPPRAPSRLPWVATIHDLIPLRHPRGFSRRQRFVFQRSLGLAASAPQVIAVSTFTADLVRRTFGTPASRIQVIPPPIDASRFSLPQRQGLAGVDRPYILHLGGFDPLKGVTDLLLPAFARLAARRPELLLALAGAPGPSRAPAEQAVREFGLESRVLWIGWLGDDDYAAAVAGASAVAVASREEGFGIPVAEALAAGVPLAVGPAAAAREAAGEYGRLSPDDSPAGFEWALDAALAAPGRDSAEGEARRRWAGRFDAPVVARQVRSVYARAAGAP